MKSERKKYILLLITMMWICFIFYMSSKPSNESLKDSSFIVDNIVKIFNIDIRYSDILTTIVRKAAHFSEYFILSALLATTCKVFKKGNVDFSLTLLICVLVAISDEFLQGFIPGRSSEVRDVIIDFSGALLLYLFYTGVSLFRSRKI